MRAPQTSSYKNTNTTERALGKRLPAALEAESALLGALLLNDDNVAQAIEVLTPDDFYVFAHRIIYEAIVTISQRTERLDIVTLQNELEKKDMLEKVGGLTYLLGLQENIPALGLVTQHSGIIKEKAILRELINSATDIITNCYNQEDQEISNILDSAEKTIFQISNRRTEQNFVQLNIWLKKTFQHLSDIKSNSGGLTGISSGFSVLDQMTSGFQKGDMVVLAGRPSMGKTVIGLNAAAHAAASGLSVGFFSLEMSAEQLTLRLLTSESTIAHQAIRNATISSDEWVELTNAAGRLAESKLFIDDTAGLDIMALRAKARKLKAQHGVDMIVIDYLQLLHSGKKHENRHQEVSEISRALKALAKELEIPIIALSQLSRGVDSRMDKRPMLSDLRESGAIEQDADLIMFIYRDIVYNPDTENPASAELIVGKQRNGPTGVVNLHFLKEIMKFEDAADSF
ncbi:MAG: replicative DNA helicase [Alteromonas naphthalenivorans]|jgi:replicative DNA helicase